MTARRHGSDGSRTRAQKRRREILDGGSGTAVGAVYAERIAADSVSRDRLGNPPAQLPYQSRRKAQFGATAPRRPTEHPL
jgi:hypothetical protein